jgi:hypothetical protein
MSTPIILVGTLPSATTGADTISHGPHDPASIDQNFVNLRDAVDGKSPIAGPGSSQAFATGALAVGTGSSTSIGFALGAVSNGQAGIWTTAVTPDSTNWLLNCNNSGDLLLRASSSSGLYLDVGTSHIATISSTGLSVTGGITASAQPAFLATCGSVADVTGDNTQYILVCDTEVFDQSSSYNTSDGYFTAPVTGKYSFSLKVALSGITSSHTYGFIEIYTSNREYVVNINPYALNTIAYSAGALEWAASETTCDMDAGDVAFIIVRIYNGTKVVDIDSARFSGHLVC